MSDKCWESSLDSCAMFAVKSLDCRIFCRSAQQCERRAKWDTGRHSMVVRVWQSVRHRMLEPLPALVCSLIQLCIWAAFCCAERFDVWLWHTMAYYGAHRWRNSLWSHSSWGLHIFGWAHYEHNTHHMHTWAKPRWLVSAHVYHTSPPVLHIINEL